MTEKILGGEHGEQVVSAVALATSSTAVLACSVCCVLPVAFPAVALALGGATLAWMENAHGWITFAAVLMIAVGWWLVRKQTTRSGRQPAMMTLYMLVGATALTGVALIWPWIEGSLMAIVKSPSSSVMDAGALIITVALAPAGI